jgi:MATE family multidrug resistance protein
MLKQQESLWSRPGGFREVVVLGLPLVISTISWTLMHFIDRVLLLGYSGDSVAAALPSGALSFAVICLPLGITSYVNTFVSQYHGAGRHDRIGSAVWQGVFIGLLFMPLVLLTIPFAPWMFEQMGHDPKIAHLEVQYFQINAWGDSAIVISAALSSFFTGRGKVRTIMIVDSLAAGINIVLDYAWIYGHWGFPEAGIAGAAWATVVALWVKTLIYLLLFLRPRYRQRYSTGVGFRLDGELFRRLLSFGTPNGMQLLVEVSGYTAFLLLVGRLGTHELTATSLALNVNNLAFMPVLGIGLATTTLVGHRMGENRPDLAARVTWSAFSIGAVYMLLISAAYILAPDLILIAHWSMVAPEELAKLRELTIALLWFVASYSLFDALNVIFSSAIKGAGDTRFVMLVTIVMAILPVVFTWTGIEYFDLGLFWAWTVMTSWIMLLGVIYLLRFLGGKWRSMRVIEESHLLEPAAIIHGGESISH